MELTKYKRLMNMPKYNYGLHKFDSALGDWGGAMNHAIGFTGSVMDSFSGVKSQNELMAESGRTVGSGTGFTYNKLNNINKDQLLSELSTENTNNTLKAAGSGAALGGSIGMAFGPIGAGIGAVAGGLIGGVVGLFGSASRKRRLQRKIIEANDRINRTNNYNLASAQGDYILNLFELEHGNTQDGELYVANKGKNLQRPKIVRR